MKMSDGDTVASLGIVLPEEDENSTKNTDSESPKTTKTSPKEPKK